MKTNGQIKSGILKNCVDKDGDIELSNLDFTGFKGNVYRSNGKVDGNLGQRNNEVKGSLHQDCNEIGVNLFQDGNEVKGDLYQNYNEVGGNLSETGNKVKGKTYTSFDQHNKVMKGDEEKNKWVEDERFTKPIEKMTKKELIKMIKELIK